MAILRLLLLFMVVGILAGCSTDLPDGKPAPDFSLPGTDGKTYTLAQFKGQKAVVIAWFPKAFTGGCTEECKSLRDSAKAIDGFDVAYFAASVDDAETNKKFAQSLSLPFPVLSDPGKETAKAYGVVRNEPYALRWTFYIDKEGKVVLVDRSVNPAKAGETLRKNLEKLGIATKK